MTMNLYDYAENKHVSPRRLVDFTLCANPLGPSNKARTAMRKMVREVGTFPDERARYLRRFLSRKEGIPEESFLFGHGSSHILSIYLQVFKPGSVSLLWPCNPGRTFLFERHGISCEPLPLINGGEGFTVDPDLILAHAGAGKTLFLMNPHDPTGATVTGPLIDKAVRAVEQSGGMLIIDEAFIEYTNLVSAARQVVESSRCLVLRSLSLFHALAGLRIGYGIAHPSLVARLADRSAPVVDPVNTMALAAARASVADKGYYARTGQYIAAEKAYVTDKVRGLAGLTVLDTPCNFVLIGLEKKIPNIAALLLNRSIFVDTFRDGEDKLWIRLPVQRRPQNARLVRTLRYLLQTSETA